MPEGERRKRVLFARQGEAGMQKRGREEVIYEQSETWSSILFDGVPVYGATHGMSQQAY